MAGVAATIFRTTCTMVRTTSCFRVFGYNPTLTQVRFVKCPSSPEAIKHDIDELKEKAAAVASQSKEATGAAETVTEKAKKSAQEAWNATKDAATKVQKKVTGEAEASAATVKENMEIAKKSMNSKK